MSEGIAPFVSSSPPPFDDDKFEDEDDLFQENSYGGASGEKNAQEMEKDKSETSKSTQNLNKVNNVVTAEKSDDGFEEFFKCEVSTTEASKIKMDKKLGNFMESQPCIKVHTFLDQNQSNAENAEEMKLECDKFDDFEEFLSHEDVDVVKPDNDNFNITNKTKYASTMCSSNFSKVPKVEKSSEIFEELMNIESTISNDDKVIEDENCGDFVESQVGIDAHTISDENRLEAKYFENENMENQEGNSFEGFISYENVEEIDSKRNDIEEESETYSTANASSSEVKGVTFNEVGDEISHKMTSLTEYNDDFEEFVCHENVDTSNLEAHDNEVHASVVSSSEGVDISMNSKFNEVQSTFNNVIVESQVKNENNFITSDNQQQLDASVVEESWADFESFTEASFSEELNDSDKEVFLNRPLKFDNDDGDDDFGGFEEAVNENTKRLYGIGAILNEIFYVQSGTTDKHVTSLLNLIGANKESKEAKDDNMWSNVWKNLEMIEKTPALNMKWKTSSLFQHFLKSVKVSQQNATSSRQANIPIFATNLYLLEPMKLHDKGLADVGDDGGTTSTNDIPKVEFDWANSVLMNPLDVGNVCHLDLDFFGDEVFASCVSPACKKEKELLESLEPSLNDPHKSLSLDSFLANMSSNNTTLIKTPADLSIPPKLKAILNKIPDLSFMQSKVLMFPVREEFTAETCS